MCRGAEAAKQILRDTEQAEKIHRSQWRPASTAGALTSVRGSGIDATVNLIGTVPLHTFFFPQGAPPVFGV